MVVCLCRVSPRISSQKPDPGETPWGRRLAPPLIALN